MRTLSILAFAAFPLGAMATLSAPPETTGGKTAGTPAGTLTGVVAAVRTMAAHLPTSGTQVWADPPPSGQDSPRLAIGEVLPDGIALYAVPRHSSYRYAVLRGQRVIVDASSRQIVYIIR